MKKHIQLLFVFLLSIIFATQAQDSTDTRKPVFAANISHQSYVHFLGRSDSLSSNATLPIISYQLKNGLYAQGAAIFIANSATPFQYTGSSVEMGYRFPQSDKFSGNIFVSRFLYKDESVLVQSALKYQTGINTSFQNKIINVNLGADLKFSNKTDVGATVGIDHLFIIKLAEGKPRAFAINPTLTAYGGTQRFTETYQQKQSPTVGGIPVGPPQTTTQTKNVNTFSILAYEYTMPLVLVVGKFNAVLSPSYVMPQNILAANGEYGRNRFYVTASVGVRF
ncbi:hypothetical protein IQ13_1902 [Lacibacter cauensis]|uniref:Outer membrane protein with beta-barrel domain n=1 Tax=Lacibacter cauensis TaxID=510947 RepID=A0A562SRA0_9BACT|nr:hypothetical protein [Lacibacter cauensis]TWI83787.1 hypothetical protein IQ13_1902 [Lacibacter cauensis]